MPEVDSRLKKSLHGQVFSNRKRWPGRRRGRFWFSGYGCGCGRGCLWFLGYFRRRFFREF